MNITVDKNVSSVNLTVHSVHNNTEEYIYQISTFSQIFNISVTFLIIFLNCFLITCLQENRSNVSKVIHMQLMSLSVSDLLAGTSLAISLLSLIDDVNRSSRACVIVVTPFMAAQYAVLLNLVVLWARRWAILRKADKPATRTEPGILQTVLFTAVPWLTTFAFYIPVMIGATTRKPSVNGCTSPEFIENEMVLKTLSLVFLGTLMILNVFVILSAVSLKRLTQPASSGFQSISQVAQQKAFKHLIVVLMVANITTLPIIVLSALFAVKEVDGQSEKMYIAIHFRALTSVINPIFYILFVDETRNAIKGKIVVCIGRNRTGANREDQDNQISVAVV